LIYLIIKRPEEEIKAKIKARKELDFDGLIQLMLAVTRYHTLVHCGKTFSVLRTFLKYKSNTFTNVTSLN
jgi:hypothetical protein